MSNSKCTLTVHHLLCYIFIFAGSFHAFSSGFRWTAQTPKTRTDAEIGKSVTLQWKYNLSENETNFITTLGFLKGNALIQLAVRLRDEPFEKTKSDIKFEVHGKQNVSLILKDVHGSLDRYFCLKVQYKFGGILQDEKRKCSQLFSYAKPFIEFYPKPMLLNVTDRITLYCNASGKPKPDLIWKKADDPSTVLASSFNLSVTGASTQGLYMCIANNSYGTQNKTFFVKVQYKPEIQYISKEQIKPEGITVLLNCTASGNPNPNIAWAKKDTMEDILIHGQGSASLKLDNISRADTGDYFCIAKNILGTTSNRTSLTVQYLPIETTLTPKPGPGVILGGELILNCTSSALPRVNVFKFYRGNSSLVGNASDGVFRISNITSSDSGEYKCVPSNTLGEGDSASVKIDVLVPPELYEPLPNSSITINESDTLELRCKANGNPLPDISLTKGSREMKLQSNTYRKENASRYDAGVYRCTANNSINKDHSEVKVIVNYAPSISYIKSHQTVNENDPVSLYCNATGQPSPSVQWFKGNASFGNMSIGSTSATLKGVELKDGGKYVCQASNLLATKCATTELIVQHKPINTKITTDTGKYEVAIHETLMLNCSAQALPSVNWFKFHTKNVTLQNSSMSTYTITKKARSPAEEYTCSPRNILGEGTPASVNISFLEQPTFTEEPIKSLIAVNETQAMKLMCLVRGTPEPNVTWTKDGSSKIIGNHKVYTKNNTNTRDTGTYRCTASNGVGRILKAEFSVVINYKPINTRLISTTGRTGVTVNESLTLNCSAQSVPPPHSYSFQVNGSTLNRTSSDSSTLTIWKDEPFYDENYTCVATNVLGDGETSNTLTITLFKRSVISSEQESVTVRENNNLTLKCQTSGKPWPNITWTKGNSTEIIETGGTYIKARAEKCDAGVYRCTADNGVKESASAQTTVTVKSYPEAPKILNIAISIPRIEVHWEQPVTNCSLPITGYLAQVKKKGSQEKWTECEVKYDKNFDRMSCTFEELESSTTYTLQIFAKNRFGNGQPAVDDFETKEGGGAYSSDASKGGLSKNDYIVIGACVGGLFLLIIIIMTIKKLKTKHGEGSLQTPIELREQEENQRTTAANIEIQNVYDGPMTGSQETLEEKGNTFGVNVIEEKEAKDIGENNKL